MNLYIGCPVWAYKGWVGDFYPEGTKSGEYLPEYARRLTTVEGNTTFYATPGPNTIEEWGRETPDSFRFCFKVPRTISHAGKLVEHIDEAVRFTEIMSPLGPRVGPMFLQLPPRYHPSLFDDLKTFLDAWPKAVRLAVEVRHLRWFEPPFYEQLNELLAGHGMARVVIDTRPIRSLEGDKILAGTVYAQLLQSRERKPDLPIMPAHTASFTFLRYIGHPQDEINAPYLDEWAGYLAARPAEETEAYVFCHCPAPDVPPYLARQFHARIAEKLPIPPLPWDQIEPDKPQQPRLF